MGKFRTVIVYKEYFEDFLKEQSPKVQMKILQILRIIEEVEVIPERHLKSIKNAKGLFEIRIIFGSDIFRVFCFFDEGRLVVLLGGFRKKSRKPSQRVIEKNLRLMKKYYEEKDY